MYKLSYERQGDISFIARETHFPCIIVYFYCYLSTVLQSDAIFVLNGIKNDIAGQKTISRDISFLCHRVIALIKAQVCDKIRYDISYHNMIMCDISYHNIIMCLCVCYRSRSRSKSPEKTKSPSPKRRSRSRSPARRKSRLVLFWENFFCKENFRRGKSKLHFGSSARL